MQMKIVFAKSATNRLSNGKEIALLRAGNTRPTLFCAFPGSRCLRYTS